MDNQDKPTATGTAKAAATRPYRTEVAAQPLTPGSLVGSFFHGTSENGWQGVVVGEPSPGTYLVELFEWVSGSGSHQELVRIEDMTGWRFYDDAEWMNNAYENGLQRQWEREREKRDGEALY